MPKLLYPFGRSSWYPLNMMMGGPHSQYGGFGGKRKIFITTRN
jgi:hypothetical protein